MKRYHVSGRPNGLPAGGEESPSKLAKNRERIAAANAKRTMPRGKRSKKAYGVSDDPSLFGWEPPREPRKAEKEES
jgi:hypothetical protein